MRSGRESYVSQLRLTAVQFFQIPTFWFGLRLRTTQFLFQDLHSAHLSESFPEKPVFSFRRPSMTRRLLLS